MRLVCLALLGCVLLTGGCATDRAMFNGRDLTGWREIGSDGAWSVIDGVLHCNGQKDGYAWLCSEGRYGDFELTLDWKISPGGNSGVFLRAPSPQGRTSMLGFEVQIIDDSAHTDLTDVSGSIFRRVNALGRYSLPVGQWNTCKITCVGRHVRVELNGQLASEAHFDTVPPQGDDPPMSDVPNVGHIGLQNHDSVVEFRNIRIREIR